MSERTIRIAGAGPAGLTAAIALAKAGRRVRVLEQRAGVGHRFNDDYQGMENWTRAEDAFDELRAFGVEPDWWGRPFDEGVLFDPALRPIEISSERPMFYLVRRGADHSGSLDRALLRQARALGVELEFGRRADPTTVDIMAGGPKGRPVAVARGMTFPVEREDGAYVLLDDGLAPGGYVYCLICGGQATLANVLFRDFPSADRRLRRAAETIVRVLGIAAPRAVRSWGGYGRFAIPASCERDGALWVGEAAGFQDFLFGFGIRHAMVSGGLAAKSILEGRSFDALWRERFLQHMKASIANRTVYAALGGLGKRALWYATGRGRDAGQVMRWVYSFSRLHHLVYRVSSRQAS